MSKSPYWEVNMKMPEKHDLLAAIRQRNKHQGNPCVCNGVPMARYNGGAFYKNSNRRNDVRHYRLVHS